MTNSNKHGSTTLLNAHDAVVRAMAGKGFVSDHMHTASCRFSRQLGGGVRQEISVRIKLRDNANSFTVELSLLRKKRLLRNTLLCCGTIDECCTFLQEHVDETTADSGQRTVAAQAG